MFFYCRRKTITVITITALCSAFSASAMKDDQNWVIEQFINSQFSDIVGSNQIQPQGKYSPNPFLPVFNTKYADPYNELQNQSPFFPAFQPRIFVGKYKKKELDRVDLQQYGRNNNIEKWKQREAPKRLVKLYRENLNKHSTVFCAGTGKQSKENAELFENGILRLGSIRFIETCMWPVLKKKYTVPVLTGVVTKLDRNGIYCTTPLSDEKQTIHTKALELLPLLCFYNYRDIENISAFVPKHDEQGMKLLRKVGFKYNKKFVPSGKVKFVLSKTKLLQICQDKNIPKEPKTKKINHMLYRKKRRTRNYSY